MNLKKFRSALFGMAFLMLSCAENTTKNQEEYQKIYEQVQAVHDTLMAKMTTDVYNLSKKMEKMADTSAAPAEYKQALHKLKASDSTMMAWMEHFGDEFVKNKTTMKDMDNRQLQARISAIRQELAKVRKMRAEMDSGIQNARNLADK